MKYKGSKFFISYRHADCDHYANLLYKKLKLNDPSCSVFYDEAKMHGGTSFIYQIKDELSNSDILILLISPYWHTKSAKDRLHDKSDILFREISYALRYRIPILPILIENTKMPDKADLPKDISVLNYTHAIGLSENTFNVNLEELFEAIQLMLHEKNRLKKVGSKMLDKLIEIDQNEWDDETRSEFDRLQSQLPRFLEKKSVSGEGVIESTICKSGVWITTVKKNGNILIIEFTILDHERSDFEGEIIYKDRYNKISSQTRMKGTWASVVDEDKHLFLGFFLEYITEDQNHEEILIPFDKEINNTFIGVDDKGLRFVSKQKEIRVEGF